MIGNAFARAFQRRGSIFRSQFEKLRHVFTRAARSLSILCTPCSEYYLPTGYLVHLEDRRPPEIFVVSVKTRQLETDLPKYKILHRRRVRTSPNEPQSNLKIQISLCRSVPLSRTDCRLKVHLVSMSALLIFQEGSPGHSAVNLMTSILFRQYKPLSWADIF